MSTKNRYSFILAMRRKFWNNLELVNLTWPDNAFMLVQSMNLEESFFLRIAFVVTQITIKNIITIYSFSVQIILPG